MIDGRTKTEANYRAVMLDSSSSLKDFSIDRKKYYRKHILNEEVEDKDAQAAVMGRIVETLLLEPELFDEKFSMSALAKAPTGKMLDFCNALCDIAIENTDESGEINKNFEDMAMEARSVAGFEWSLKVILDKFIGGDPEIYYKELRIVKSKHLTVVTTQDVENAERIVQELKINPVTCDVVNLVNSDRWKILTQYQVEGFEIDGHLFKSMMDRVIIDNVNKTIQVYDLKCVWAVEQFLNEYYLYRHAYIQAYVYYCAALYMAREGGEFEGYSVEIPKFIVCDSTNYFNPLIYVLDESDLKDAYEGFEYKGREYKGVKELIEDLKWALDMNTWNISRANYETNGVVKLRKC